MANSMQIIRLYTQYLCLLVTVVLLSTSTNIGKSDQCSLLTIPFQTGKKPVKKTQFLHALLPLAKVSAKMLLFSVY
jgi:hypothetical protein